jgi:adenylate kinase family enzyme
VGARDLGKMTEILCRWLNEDVRVAHKLSDANLAEQFSSGYLFGEVLAKYGLQEDFPQFSKGRSSEAKLNNFMRLEPTFRLLEVPFNINLARDVMNERPGAAMRLLYQLFVALSRMKKQELNGQSLEFTRSPGRMKLEKVETSIFRERLKHQTPRQVDLNFEELIDRFKDRQRVYEEGVTRDRQRQAEKLRQEKRENCHRALERTREAREKQNLMYSKLKPISPTKTPQPKDPATSEMRTVEGRRSRRADAEAEETRVNINSFEARLRTLPASGMTTLPLQLTADLTKGNNTGPGSTGDYMSQIKRRTLVIQAGREEREKRRRHVLVQQMMALQEQEEERRKQQLVERLMRQCQQESRIATQLMHIRRQKDTIRNNRIFRQKQFEEQRMREFQEELNRNEALAKQGEKERRALELHHLKLYRQHKAQQAELNYRKHYQLAASIVDQMLDFSTKIAEYRVLTENMVPAKVVRDWKTLLIAGQPLYPQQEEEEEGERSSGSRGSQSTCSVPPSDLVRESLLEETDFWQYRNVEVDWELESGEKTAVDLPEAYCPILTHVVYSLLDIVDPPQPPPSPPHFPKFFLRASLLGKPFSGKTTVLNQLSRQLGIVVLCPSQLVERAVQQYLTEKTSLEAQLTTSQDEETPVISGRDDQLEGEGSGLSEEDSNSGDVDGESPVVGEGNEELEYQQTAVETAVEGEEEEKEEGEGEEKEGTSQQISSQELPLYFSELSVMGSLGCRAFLSLSRGDQISDQVTVDIIVESLRDLPEQSSWILDNYPTTLEQAKMLSCSLTGECAAKSRFSRDFVLLPEHQMKNMELQAAAGLDLVVHLKATSETVLRRAAHHASEQGTKLSQIQHRLLSFEAGWPRLKRWLQKFRILTTVNTSQDIERVVIAVHDKVKDIINKSKQHEALLKLGVTRSSMQLSSGSTTSLPMLKKLQALPQPPSKHHPLEKKATKSKRTRRPSSAGAPPLLHVIQQADKMVAVREEEKVSPGGSGWEYCSLPIASEMAECLAGKWGEIERCYTSVLKSAFRHLRQEREIICRYFHKRKGEFVEYLKRPDTKQELVSQWQANFNSIPTHLRREDTMKAELHCTVDDLCDRLWDVCDKRKEEWETERERIWNEKWLEDHLGLITNTYLSLMQAEVVKFQETVHLLQDYYCSMAESVPAQLPSPARLALVELVATEPQNPPSSSTDFTPEPQLSSKSSFRKSGKVPLVPRQPPPPTTSDDKTGGGGGGKKKDKGSTEDSVPIPPLEETAGLELDQQLVVHTFNTALTTLTSLVYPRVKALDSSIEVTKTLLQPAAPPAGQGTVSGAHADDDKKTGGKGGKDKGGKATPAKKGKQTPAKKGAPDPPQPVETPAAPLLSPEEREKKEKLIKAWREHKAALQHQEYSVRQRLKLIKSKAVEVVAYLKSVAGKMYEDMGEWLGRNYVEEVDCVTQLTNILRQAVEEEDPLSQEITIPGKSFFFDGSVVVYEEAPPPTPPIPPETPPPGVFSVAQLSKLESQLSSVAPDGVMLAQSFVQTLHGFTENAVRHINSLQG